MKKHALFALIFGIVMSIMTAAIFSPHAFAENFITVSPMYQNKVLVPGEKEIGTFTVAVPASAFGSINEQEFEVYVKPFSISYDKIDNNVSFSENEHYSQIVDWVEIKNPKGKLKPNESEEIEFSIDVPEDAPAGGQYFALIVRGKQKEEEGMVRENFEMAHLVYAEVAGSTIRSGDITELGLSGFMFSGNITGGASVTNTGNVHANAVHFLKVFPLFGNEEYFTNEENPQENLIIPGGKRYTAVSWDKTPSIGIFRAEYSVEFEGVKKTLNKIVIICPLWLLILAVIAVVLIIIRMMTNHKKKHVKRAEATE